MSTKAITDAFRMKKRLHSGAEKLKGDITTKISRKNLKSPEGVIKNTDPKEGIKTPTRPGCSKKCDESPISTQATTPLRLTQFYSQDGTNEIVWDFNSPEFRKHLKSVRRQTGNEVKNIEAIMKQLGSKDEDIQSQSSYLLNLWMKSNRNENFNEASDSRDSINDISDIKNHESRVSVSDELANLLHKIEETTDHPTSAEQCDYFTSIQSVVKSADIPPSPIFDAPLFTPKRPPLSIGCGNDDIWDDDDLFYDDAFIQQTQLTEEEYFSKQSEPEGFNRDSSSGSGATATAQKNTLNNRVDSKNDFTIADIEVSCAEDFEMECFFPGICEKAVLEKENPVPKGLNNNSDQALSKDFEQVDRSFTTKAKPFTLLQDKTCNLQPSASESYNLSKIRPTSLDLTMNKTNKTADSFKTPTATGNSNSKSSSQYKFKKIPSGLKKYVSAPQPVHQTSTPKPVPEIVNIKDNCISSAKIQTPSEMNIGECSELLCNDEDFLQPEILSMLDQLDNDPVLSESQKKNEDASYKCSQEEIAKKRAAALKRRQAKRHSTIS